MKTIVLPVDFSSSTALLSEKTITLANAFASTVYLIHVVLPNEDCDASGVYEMCDEFDEEFQTMNGLANELREQGVETHALLLEGVAASVILSEARRLNADLIVMGSHGHGAVVGALMGDVSQSVTRDSFCPLLIVPTRS